MTTEYEFTQDWFHWAPEVWTQLIPHLPEGETYGTADRGLRQFLEIGSFEGRSAVWIMENMMGDGDFLNCVDTWEGGEEHSKEQMQGTWDRFCHNMKIVTEKFPNRYYNSYRCTSVEALGEMHTEDPGPYHFIYIDGSHVAKDVMTDACMAWPLLKEGGIMVFDDYLWGEPVAVTHKPKLAIDCFTTLFGEELDIIHLGYQLIVRKRKGAK